MYGEMANSLAMTPWLKQLATYRSYQNPYDNTNNNNDNRSLYYQLKTPAPTWAHIQRIYE